MKLNWNIHNQEMPSRNLDLVYHLDANRINAIQKNASVNQLEQWHKNEVIFLEMSGTAYDEARSGSGLDSDIRREKADDYTFIAANDSLGFEGEWRTLIEQILFPHGAKAQNERNDISILLDAKIGGATLITSDRSHILQNADRLSSSVGIRVITAKQAVIEIRKCIRRRDAVSNNIARTTGCEVPEWVGKD
jgi:hypothetical protein